MTAAYWFVGFLSVYAGLGLAFAVAFVAVGVQRVDPVAEHAPLGFRLIILPGAAALWPLLLVRWISGRSE
jgi:hypothetical protein